VVVVVGSHPSFEEDANARPFIGSTGEYLKNVYLNGSGLSSLSHIYLTNSIRCFPVGVRNPAFRKNELTACLAHLTADLLSIEKAHPNSPLFLLLTGGTPARQILNSSTTDAFKLQGQEVSFGGSPWRVFSTYNPAYLAPWNKPAALHAVTEHLTRLIDTIENGSSPSHDPSISRPRFPLPSDSSILCVDIETYGACRKTIFNQELPDQTVFHPARSIFTDSVNPRDLIQTVSITLCEMPSSLSSLSPITTLVFKPRNLSHLSMLKAWLSHATLLIGHYLQFDLLYLHYAKMISSDREVQLVDLSVVNYLENEAREERSLKDLGPLLGTHSYHRTIKDGKFYSPNDPEIIEYNALDTEATVLALAKLAGRLESRPDTDKLSPYCLSFYADTIWTCVDMALNGIAMDAPSIERIEFMNLRQMKWARKRARRMGLLLEGKGSVRSKDRFMAKLLAVAKTHPDFNGGQVELTEAAKKVSAKDANRNYLSTLLPEGHRLEKLTHYFDLYQKASKLVSSYTFPLLRHSPKNEKKQASRLIPIRVDGEVATIAYPTWYPIPGAIKDGEGSEGGTLQARITCKGPAIQTLPYSIKSTITSRWLGGSMFMFDLSQIELRVAGLLSGEPSLIENYQRGGDLHTQRTIQMFGEDIVRDPYFKSQYRQVGKAQPVDEPVMTPEGPKTIGSLKVGDKIYGSNGITSVTGIYPQGVKPIYKISFYDGSWTRCCGEHLWKVTDTQGKEEVISLDTLRTRDLSWQKGWRYEIPVGQPFETSELDLDIPPYTLGAFLGDGSITCGTPILVNDEKDNEIVERIAEELDGWGLVIERKFRHAVCFSMGTRGRTKINPLKGALGSLDCWGKNAHSKRIPLRYLAASVPQRVDLLRGLMDTDGTITPRGSASYTTVSKQLALDVCELVRSLGGVAKVRKRPTSHTYRGVKKEGFAWCVTIRTPMNCFHLKRKADRWSPFRMFRKIVGIEPAGESECVCISVDAGDRLYATRDYLLTHNTINFADLFLSSPGTMRDTVMGKLGIDLPLSFFEGVANSRHKVRPRLMDWQAQLLMEAKTKNILELPFVGVSRWFPGHAMDIEKVKSTVVNFPVQSTAALTLLNIQHHVRHLLRERKLRSLQVLNIYDCVGIDVYPGEEQAVKDLFHDCVVEVQKNDYWSKVQTHYGNEVPIEYELSEKKR
jgi:uracil-DNA glycosylase family 4